MKCIFCQGTMARGTAPFHVDRRDYHLLFDAIPAWICDQCGEVYFEEGAVTSIQETVRTLDDQAARLSTLV
jgi:YgiT-type zinc finger domain-containing protein